MSSGHADAPEVPGSFAETSSDGQWSAAARSEGEFVFAEEDDAGHVVSRHLMVWHPPPKRAYATGLTGSARVLESRPGIGAPRGEGDLRIHVCRHKPCPSRRNHPSKYGTAPCPQAHGRIVAWGREAWDKRTGGGVPVVCGVPDDAVQEAAAVAATEVTDNRVPPMMVSAEDTAVTTSILRRAFEMKTAGCYIGLWEILCWCGVCETRCRLLLAEGVVDIVEAFAPNVLPHPRPRGPCAHVMVGCRADVGDEGPHPVWIPSGMADLSHFVAGIAMGSAMPSGGRTVRDHCLRHGFAPVMTVTNGDCGIDAMLIMA